MARNGAYTYLGLRGVRRVTVSSSSVTDAILVQCSKNLLTSAFMRRIS